MRSSRREVQIGLFVLIGIVAVILALLMLTDPGTFRGRINVTTAVSNAGGIRKGDPVQMRGVNIGRIRQFAIGPGGVVISLELEKEYPVPNDSHVLLKSNGLLGGMVADIVPGRSPERVKDGDVIPGATEAGMFDEAAGVGARADTVLARAQMLLAPNNIQAVSASTVQLQTLLTQLAGMASEQRGQIAALSASLRRSAAGVEKATTRPELVRSVARMDSITRQLDQATASLNRSSNSMEVVLGRLERGEGTLGRLSKDESLYNNLNQAAVSANQAATNTSQAATNASSLMADIKANPKKYINLRVF